MYSQKLTGMQVAVLLCICRKTFGYRKDRDRISIGYLADQTGYTRPRVCGAVHDLECMGILEVTRCGAGKTSKISIRDPDYWDKPVLCREPVPCRAISSSLQGNRVVPCRETEVVPSGATQLFPSGEHTKEKRKKKDLKKGDRLPDGGDAMQKDSRYVHEGDDLLEDDWEDPEEIGRRWEAN